MQIRESYNSWSATYDGVENKTRDLEAGAIRAVLAEVQVDEILEIGCGTGKNTGWLAAKCKKITAVDFSKEMLAIARQKWRNEPVLFREADITKTWQFQAVNLITCSLVLEHIEDIAFVLLQAAATLKPGGQFFICELHPYRQLTGSRAKFEKEGKLHELPYFVHHISAFFNAAKNAGLVLEQLDEWFDEDKQNPLPRLVSFVFKKP